MKSESTKLYESDVRPIFKQILLAIDYLHNKNIAHLDLKLENILY
jgi:serine/threonine protein kinase